MFYKLKMPISGLGDGCHFWTWLGFFLGLRQCSSRAWKEPWVYVEFSSFVLCVLLKNIVLAT
jgi:hypothetical protein